MGYGHLCGVGGNSTLFKVPNVPLTSKPPSKYVIFILFCQMTIPMHHHMPTGATQVLQSGSTHDTSGGVSRGGMPSGQQKHSNNKIAATAYQGGGFWSQGHS